MDNNENQELDLLDVLKSIGNAIAKFFSFVLRIIGWIFRLIYQYKYVCIACTLLFVVLGIFMNKGKIYRAETDLRMNSYPSYFVKDILDPLHLQCLSGDSLNLASELNLTPAEAKTITDIRSFYYMDIQNNGSPDYIDYEGTFDAKDTSMSIVPWRLKLRVEGKDTTILRKMTEALSYLFANNEQIKRENELRTTQLDDRIAFVDREIQLLDSLRKKEYFQKKKEVSVTMDKTVLLNEREMKLFHSDLLELNKLKQELEWERVFYAQGFIFENEFTYDLRPINRISNSIPKFVLIGFLLSVILCGCWKFKERISNYLNRQV